LYISKKNIIIIGIIIIAAIVMIIRMSKIEAERKADMEALLNQPKTELELTMEAYNKRKNDSIIKYNIANPLPKTVQSEKANTSSTNILKFSSSFNDYEDQVNILQTNIETSYHTFDFDNKIITQKLPLRNGGWKTTQFRWTKITEPYPNGYIEFDIVNDKGIYQIWKDAAGSIGYEFYNKTKLVFNDVKRIN